MKKLFICAAVLGLVAASASAETLMEQRATWPVMEATGTEMTALPNNPPGPHASIYHNLYGSYSYVVTGPAAGGFVAFDDFNENIPWDSAWWPVHQFKFVGGVAQANDVLFFTFWNSTSFVAYEGFGVRLPQAGDFIWTINITYPTNLIIHNGDKVSMWADTGIYGITQSANWYLDAALPIDGTTGPTLPGYTAGSVPLNMKFSIWVPEPATLTMLGLGVLTLVLRRR